MGRNGRFFDITPRAEVGLTQHGYLGTSQYIFYCTEFMIVRGEGVVEMAHHEFVVDFAARNDELSGRLFIITF